MSALLTASGLKVSLGGREIIRDTSLQVESGELVAIIGPNGAGKTTLVRALAGLVPSSGEIHLGPDLLTTLSPAKRARQLAYLPQGHVFHWPMPVREIVALGRLPHGAGVDLGEADRIAVDWAMAATGTSDFADRAVTTLSGGERARVALARVLAVGAPVILADEPVAALDPRYRLLVMEMLRDAARKGGAVMVVLHDLALAARFADRIIVLHQGSVAAAGSPSGLLSDALLREVFGIEAARFTRGDVEVLVPWSAVQAR